MFSWWYVYAWSQDGPKPKLKGDSENLNEIFLRFRNLAPGWAISLRATLYNVKNVCIIPHFISGSITILTVTVPYPTLVLHHMSLTIHIVVLFA